MRRLKRVGIDGSYPNHPTIETVMDTPFVENVMERILEKPHRLVEEIGRWKYRSDFRRVERFVLFVGHPRSGHSLIGALLDAHPRMIVAHELDALQSVSRGISRGQLFFQLHARSQWFMRNGATCEDYSYDVPSQHKGEFSSLRVIGDKKGGRSTTRLREDPSLLRRLQETVRLPIHVLHVKRHPLDNIATMARKADGDIDWAIDAYFRDCTTVKSVRKRVLGEDWLQWLDVVQEDVVRDTEVSLRRMCEFLGVDAPSDYLSDCADIVFDTPSRSRDTVTYTASHLTEIRNRMASFPSLDRYAVE